MSGGYLGGNYWNGSGYYVLFKSTLDMYRERNPIRLGTSAYKNSSGYGESQKRLNFLRESNGNYIRLYDSRRNYKWYNDEAVKEKFPEYFI